MSCGILYEQSRARAPCPYIRQIMEAWHEPPPKRPHALRYVCVAALVLGACACLLVQATRDVVAYRGDDAPLLPCDPAQALSRDVRRKLMRAMSRRCAAAASSAAFVAPQFNVNGEPSRVCLAYSCTAMRAYEAPRVAMSSSSARVTCRERSPRGVAHLQARRCPMLLADDTVIDDALECCSLHAAIERLERGSLKSGYP